MPGAQTTSINTTIVFSAGNGNAISIADADTGANAVQVSLTATNGTLTLASIAGLTFTTGDGTADASMTFSGTVTAINTAFAGLQFSPSAGYSGAANLQIITDDLGNSGLGGAMSDTDAVAITVQSSAIIDVQRPAGTSIANTGTDALSANLQAGSPTNLTYTIANIGTQPLDLTGSPAIAIVGTTNGSVLITVAADEPRTRARPVG